MSWSRFKEHYLPIESLGFSLDISRIKFPEGYLDEMAPRVQKAFEQMAELEKGAIANPDEERMVGHYWLRDPKLAPEETITRDIESTVARIKKFADQVHSGEIKGSGGAFKNLLIIGIGGSALGPQFVSQALAHPTEAKLAISFFDNTDPDGMERVLTKLDGELGQTLSIVISKSGGTAETRNGMIEAEQAYQAAGLTFAQHAVAITGESSKLDRYASAAGWVARFPMWDWVGGRTSELATVGLLPAALEGIDIDALLKGAQEMDAVTRNPSMSTNPAALLALMWYFVTDGTGSKDMVILPYKDRLMLFSKYLQQLVMESLGKKHDLEGNVVHQGIAVYGNKGSTDQHAYVQQLRDGVLNFFVTFIQVLKDRDGAPVLVEDDFTSGDFLQGFYLGTRDALYDSDRQSITITIDEVSAHSVGMLIALYERAVGFYASLVGINAYHQPGVEAGKKAAAATLEIQKKVIDALKAQPAREFTAEELAQEIGEESQTEVIFKLLEHLAANPAKNVKKMSRQPFFETKYSQAS